MTPSDPADVGELSLETAQARGFYSLLYLAQALGKHGTTGPVQIVVVANGIQPLTDSDRFVPEKTTLLGPCTVIPQEYPHIRCRSIDIVLPEADSRAAARLVEQLLAELIAPLAEPMVAYRGRQRWVRDVAPLHLDAPAGAHSRLREGGVYLITGGLGAVAGGPCRK